MNPRLTLLQDYPFERMLALKQGSSGARKYDHVALSIGEPKHPPADFIVDLLDDRSQLTTDLGIYPTTRGTQELRQSISTWLMRRFGANVDPDSGILPVSGTREAVFSFGQAVLSGASGSLGILPNPFYQIYEGAVLLGGASPYYVNAEPDNGYLADYRSIPTAIWQRCELLFLCSPGNPTGRVIDSVTLFWLIEQAQRHNFVIAADECYSEIYLDESAPPTGLLQAAAQAGLDDFNNCVVFHSLSKRSNLPGLRSGFVAGDAQILDQYFQYRTYQGCALPMHVQRASSAAWSDESHVIANRMAYAEKFACVSPILREAFSFDDPAGGFYHWLNVEGDDARFALELFKSQNITVLPGSFLSREAHGRNPGAGHIRVAWVAQLADCQAAARRLVDWTLNVRLSEEA